MKFWFDEMSRLSLVVGAGICAGWFASGAVLTAPAAPIEKASAPILLAEAAELLPQRPLLPQRTTIRLAQGPDASEEPDAAAPARQINFLPDHGRRPEACSLKPRDQVDERPIGAPEMFDRRKTHIVACG